jgi:cyanophycinase-like exopeptidase
MTAPILPIYLLADSQLLFWKRDDALFLESVKALLPSASPKAAYIGASNGDVPEFYGIFEAAMAGVGIRDCRMIVASYPAEDAQFLSQADLILLAGGDAERGWRTIKETGMGDAIIKRYYEGALVIGTSAGAVQLGLYGCIEKGPSNNELFETLKLVPFMIDVHDERNDWSRLRDTVTLLNSSVKGVGIPAGGGIIYHPDGDLEPIRYPVDGFAVTDGQLERNVLLPEHTNR